MTALDPAERPGATEIAIRLCEMQADPDVGRSRTEGLALDQPRQQVEATAALVPVAGDGPAAMPLAEVEADQAPSTDGENDDAVRRRDGDRLSPRRMASRRARLSAYVAAAAALVAAVALLTGGFRSGPISVRQSPKTPSTLVTVPDGEQNEADIIEHDTEKPSTTTSSAPSSTTVIASVDTGSGTGAEGGASTSATGSSPSTSTPTTAPATTTTSEPEAPTTTEPPPSTVGADSPSTTVAATPGGD